MQAAQWSKWAIAITIIAGIAVAIAFRARPNLEARGQLTDLMNQLAVRETHTIVEETFRTTKTSKLELLQLSNSLWLVRTPPELGARNWQLWIQFEGDSVKKLEIRLADSRNMKPSDAPPDKF